MAIKIGSSWEEVKRADYPKLTQDREADIVIVGGGLAGIMTAYLLVKAGKKVIVLEKDKIGNGATASTTAFITQDVDTNFAELIDLFGEQYAKLVWQSGGEAINLIEQIITDEKIDCEFTRCSVYNYANDKKELEELEETQAKESEHGLNVGPIRTDQNLNFPNAGYYEIFHQAKFHPLKFLYALADKARSLGAEIYEQTEVKKIEHHETTVVKTETNIVSAEDVIVATYQPFNNRIRLFLKKGMYKSFVFEVKIPQEAIPEGMYVGNDNPYHYFRIDKMEDYSRMIIGGEDIKTMVKINEDKNFTALEEYLQKVLPSGEYEIIKRWGGPILEPSDGLALIGKVRDHEYVASAFSGNGMTYSAISALIIRDQILGTSNVYAKVYDPRRIPGIKQLFTKGSDYIDEFFGGAKNITKKPRPAS